MDIQNPHDKFVKESLGHVETAQDFLRNYLPQTILPLIDVSTLEPQKDSFIDEKLKESEERIVNLIGTTHKEGSEFAMRLAEKYRKEGLEQGLQQGIEMGGAKALSEAMLLLLIEKFGTVPQEIKTAIAKADVPTLKLILPKVLTMNTLDELRRYLP